MAGRISYYGNIVKDGLVLCLDASKRDSYPGTGTSWLDISGFNNNATLVSGPTFNTSYPKYIRCDGTNDFIDIPSSNSLSFGTSNFTVEYWFRKLQTTSLFDNIWGVSKWSTTGTPGGNEWALSIGEFLTGGSTNKYSFNVEVGSTIYTTGDSTELISLNTWYQLVGVRDGGTLKTYVNGVLKQNVSPIGFTSNSSVNSVNRNLRLSNSDANILYTRADSANLKIYSKALTDSEVLQNFDATKSRFGL